MSFISHLQCICCGASYPADTVMNLCPVDDSPVQVIMDLQNLMTEQPDQSWSLPDVVIYYPTGGGTGIPGDKVVAFNTGSLEKYLPDLRHLL